MAANRRASVLDDEQLARQGHKPELTRQFSFLSMLGLAFAVLNSWTALSTSLSLALPAGGPTSVLWGLVTAGVCNLALSASLAEFLSAYPSAGGQYEWVAIISPPHLKAPLSWVCGYINTAGWIALTCTGGLLGGQVIIACILLQNPNFTSQPWLQFVIYVAITLLAFFINAFGNRFLNKINRAAFFWSITGFCVICVTLLACNSGNYSSADFVFRQFANTTGWPDGIAWLLGLLQGSLGLIGYDATSHMIEEIPNATVNGPRIMVACVGIGVSTGFIFLMILLFVGGGADSFNDLVSSPLGPLVQIFYTATRSQAGTICLLMFPILCLVFATTAIMTTSSRMAFAFARDKGLPWHKGFARVNQRLGMPLNSLILTAVLVTLFGAILLGSTAALNAIISASVVALNVSYAMPIAVNVCQGRRALPPRPFELPPALGWAANILGLAFVTLTTVLFLFPPSLPVDAANMNYCIAAFGIVMIICLVHWVVEGRHVYTGPSIDPEILVATTSNPLDRTMTGGDDVEATIAQAKINKFA